MKRIHNILTFKLLCSADYRFKCHIESQRFVNGFIRPLSMGQNTKIRQINGHFIRRDLILRQI